MFDGLRSILTSRTVVYECRECGTCVDRPDQQCPTCGTDSIARYAV